MLLSSAVVFVGLGLGWWLYGRKPVRSADEPDVLERLQPEVFALLRRKYFVDEIYEASVIRFNAWWARALRLAGSLGLERRGAIALAPGGWPRLA